MPELIEVEQYRRSLDALLGGVVDAIAILHPDFARPRDVRLDGFQRLVGGVLTHTDRVGKLLIMSIEQGGVMETVGVRFGMTGRLLVNGSCPIDELEYSSPRNDPAWDRARLVIGGAEVLVRDQRRLGSIELNPDLGCLGVEASTISRSDLGLIVEGRRVAVKTALLDQRRIAGLGNLLVDEILWRANIDPGRASSQLSDSEIDGLAPTIRTTVSELSDRGGSNTGDSFGCRQPHSACPRCGEEFVRAIIGGRSTWWCEGHQR